jgi:N-acetylglucosaminyldiphosphoundecaprenol N-acetyl-beta-D-mannosaminyltransferase
MVRTRSEFSKVDRVQVVAQRPTPERIRSETDTASALPLLSPPNRVMLAGVQIDNLDEQGVISRVLDELSAGRGGRVISSNVDILRQVNADPELHSLVKQSDIVIADGTPLVWASHLRKTPLLERVPGSKLLWSLSGAAADRNIPVFLLGGNPGVAERAGVALCDRYPNLSVAGTHCPPFGFESDDAQMKAIVDAVESSSPGLVFCGLGFPKQERLMEVLVNRFPTIWFISSGVSFSMAAGDVHRGPKWMQSMGLEWLFRLVQEPRRLFSRYIIHDIPFALLLLLSSMRNLPSDPIDVATESNRIAGG